MEVELLEDHVFYLLTKYDLEVSRWLTKPGWNSTDLDGDDLRIAHIVDEECYCSALHELGHIRMQTKDEILAWQWAKRNAVYWSGEMDDVMFRCLAMYKLC